MVVTLPTSRPTAANAALVESWQLSLHGKQPRTVRHYLDEVWRFASWLDEHDRPASKPGDLLAVGRKDVEAWLSAQRAAGLSQATMRNRWVAAQPVRLGGGRRGAGAQPARAGGRGQVEHAGA